MCRNIQKTIEHFEKFCQIGDRGVAKKSKCHTFCCFPDWGIPGSFVPDIQLHAYASASGEVPQSSGMSSRLNRASTALPWTLRGSLHSRTASAKIFYNSMQSSLTKSSENRARRRTSNLRACPWLNVR